MLAASLVAVPTFAQTQSPASDKPSTADVVPLVFDWAVGTAARIEVTKSQVRSENGAVSDSTVSAVAYTMQVGPHPDGLLIKHSDVEIGKLLGTAAGAAMADADMNQLVSANVGTLLPDFVVNTDGALVALDDVDTLVEAYRELILAATDSDTAADPEAEARAEAFLDGFLSPQTLTAITANEWNVAVGGWAGAEMEVGGVFEVPTEGSFPLIPGATIPMVSTYSAPERVPCTKGDAVARCIVLKLVSRYDQDAIVSVLEEFAAGLAPDDAVTPRFGDFQSETGARIVTDPATLLPYRVETYKDFVVTISAPAEEAGTFTRQDRKVAVYSYDN